MKKGILAVVICVFSLVFVAAGAQITRSEFDELKEQVESLERQARENKAHINLLRHWQRDMEDRGEEVSAREEMQKEKEPEEEVLLTRNFRASSGPSGRQGLLRGEVKNVSPHPVYNVRVVVKHIDGQGHKVGEREFRTRKLSPGEIWSISERPDRKVFVGHEAEVQSIDYKLEED